MDRFNIFFEHSALWIVPALALAGFFSWLLYKRASTFSENLKRLLVFVRFVLLAILLILLIAPVIRQVINHYEKPVMIIAVDNSTSLTAAVDSSRLITQLKSFSSSLNDEYQVEYRTLNNNIEELNDLSFDNLTTDLNNLLQGISNDYENRNLAAVVVVSDGLFNHGLNPVYGEYGYPVYTIGVGDTTIYSDIGIHQLLYNKLSYQGNKIPLLVKIAHTRFAGKSAKVSIIHDGKAIAEKDITFNQQKGIHNEQFIIEANDKGLQRYEVVLSSAEEEKNISNNSKTAFIDIVEGKKRILLIAPRPHPDIKAIKSAIITNQNYEFIQYIPVIGNQSAKQLINQPVDLVIMHQLPAASMNNDPVYKRFSAPGVRKLWITGNTIDFTQFNRLNKTLKINRVVSGQSDNVTAWFNNEYQAFSLTDDLKGLFNSLPPIVVPFGTYDIAPLSDVLLNQQVGKVQTNKPLFVTSNNDGTREGVFLGNGLWQWRVYEYAQFQTHDRFNELITKTVQYLSTREDKRKFRFYPVKNEFNEGEQVIFESEMYNELYERVYGHQIEIILKTKEGQAKNYQFVTSENSTRYAIGGLAPGIYYYTAKVNYNSELLQVSGEFAVNKLDLENVRLTADFHLLQELSQNTGGVFYSSEHADELALNLNKKDFKDKIQSSEDFLPLINIKWIGILLLLLASLEWVTRKYHGAY